MLDILFAAALAQATVPPVRGLCSAPVPDDRDTPGCYQTNEIELSDPPRNIYWQIFEYSTPSAAMTESARHKWSAVTQVHGRVWLYVLAARSQKITSGIKRAMIGPLRAPAGPVTAHFAEAIFSPGMRTRVHSHPGPEAFYVVEGEQCMEAPGDKRIIRAGETYVVASGPHLQAAPQGRRNLVLILAPKGAAFVIPGTGEWRASNYCD